MNGHHVASPVKHTPDVQTKTEKLIPFAHLLSRELQNERIPRPVIRFGHATMPKKGEDFTFIKTECQRIPGDRSSAFAVFTVLDGHNGAAAATYARDNLLKDVMGTVPTSLSRDEWLAVLPGAMVAGFVKTDKDFRKREQSSGTTVTFVVVDRWTVTVASLGDSRCILDCQGGSVSTLTVDHRLEENKEERDRVIASGGEVGRLSLVEGVEIGALRCWPGGLCLSRSIGDVDVGELIVPIPHVKQVKLSSAGGRLIIASDGVWDALSSERAAKCCRGLPAELAAKQVVKEALKTRGLQDDVTCLVVDIIPPEVSTPCPSATVKKKKKQQQSKIRAFLFGRRSRQSRSSSPEKPSEVGIVEELFEQGSAILAERLGFDSPAPAATGLLHCSVCQADITPREGISVHAGSFFSVGEKPWEGPFLCGHCRLKNCSMGSKEQSSVRDYGV